jgi:hypothetical protein
MTLLSLVQKVLQRFGLPTTNTVVGTTDGRITQMMALLEEEGQSLAARHTWNGLQTEAVITTNGLEDQGNIETLAPGYNYIRNETLWDRTHVLPVLGPLSDKDWQGLKAISNTGPRYQFRLRGNNLLVLPAPAVSHTFAFEYQSDNWILDVDGTTTKDSFTADTDTFRIPEVLLLSGLRWRWAAEKGLEYSELFNNYEYQVKDAIARDGGRKTLHSDFEHIHQAPGIYIPNGNWTVP